jgi:hypothetical protein
LPDISVVREDEVETILQETVQTQKFPKRDAKLNPNEEAAYRGYFEFSEVRFDRFHDHAVLDFEFVCPGLCGRGEQVWLVKKHGEWTVEERCLTWRS